MEWLDNYEAALTQAKREGKPIFIDFTGVTCTNCRVIEDTVFPKPEVQEELRKFVTVRLYTDKDSDISREYQKLQEKKYGQTTLPLYAVENPEGTKIAERDYDPPSPGTFVTFLQRAHSMAQTNQMASGR